MEQLSAVVEVGNTTLVRCDCLDYMRSLPVGAFDVVLTDPQYGIDHIHAGGRSEANGWNSELYHGEWDKERPRREYFDEMLRVGKTVIIWGGNYFTDFLPPTMRWLIWDKGQRNFSLSDFEMAWTNQWKASRIFDYPRSAALQDGKVHPTQKPVVLMDWCLETCGIPKGSTVFDPFMGSGTTGVSCLKTGRQFTGCERDKTYFQGTVERIRLAAAQGILF